MKNKYIIINKTTLEERINELRLLSNQPETSVYDVNVEGFVLGELEQLLLQSTPLIPEIEKAFDAGRVLSNKSQLYTPNFYWTKENYIKNLNLDI